MEAAIAALFPNSMEESEIGLVPSGWNVKPAADLFEVGIGRTPPRKEPQWFCKGTEGIPWVSIRDMGTFETYSHGTNEGLTQAAVDKFKVPVVPENTVLMSFKLTVGKLCISDTDLVTNEAIAHFKISQNLSSKNSINFLINEINKINPTLEKYNPEQKKEILTMHLIQALDEIRFKLDHGLTILASIGSCAPFVGLFGTVWGIYHALGNIAQQGNAGLNIVAGPISEALIATAFGLFQNMSAKGTLG